MISRRKFVKFLAVGGIATIVGINLPAAPEREIPKELIDKISETMAKNVSNAYGGRGSVGWKTYTTVNLNKNWMRRISVGATL